LKTAVDIFSGAGGMSVGSVMAGIEPILAVEFDVYAAKTYNFLNVKYIRNHDGDTIVFEQYRGTEFTLEGEDYLVLEIDNIIGVL
jgi:site-specific DNA-cytosine methylase